MKFNFETYKLEFGYLNSLKLSMELKMYDKVLPCPTEKNIKLIRVTSYSVMNSEPSSSVMNSEPSSSVMNSEVNVVGLISRNKYKPYSLIHQD